jgi:aspartate dehydrogenase
VYLPSGAIAGLDALKAVRDELESVVLVTTKNPNSLKGAPFFDSSDIDPEKISEPTVLFDGTAKEAVSLFPKNVNVSALLSLVGMGGDNTSVRVVADPNTDKNTHEVNANGKFGNLKITVENVPDSMNPKTSRLATLSAVELLRQICTKEVQIGT